MRVLTSLKSVRVLGVCAVLAIGCVAPIGCGESAPATGTPTQAPPEIKKANNAMEDFVKSKAQEKPAEKK